MKKMHMTNPFDHAPALRAEFDGASDRAAAVVAAAFLDKLLMELLREYFVEDAASDKKVFDGTRPLSTFSAKIDIAYRLGLISAREPKPSMRCDRSETILLMSLATSLSTPNPSRHDARTLKRPLQWWFPPSYLCLRQARSRRSLQ